LSLRSVFPAGSTPAPPPDPPPCLEFYVVFLRSVVAQCYSSDLNRFRVVFLLSVIRELRIDFSRSVFAECYWL
jgi:hypothetical protein